MHRGGEEQKERIRRQFDHSIMIDFQGGVVPSSSSVWAELPGGP